MESENIPTYVIATAGSSKLSTKTININGSDDPFYRYKMRVLYTQVVGKGKMIKTALLNVDEVAKDLKVNPAYLTVYLGYEFQCKSTFEPKKPERERASLSGTREASQLCVLMKKFIDEFVMCPRCQLPEVTHYIENKHVCTKCHSCGESAALKLKEKFEVYVLNHPPATQQAKATSSAKAAKRDLNPEKQAAQQKISRQKEEAEQVEWSTSTSKEAVKERKKHMVPESETSAPLLEEQIEEKDPISALKSFVGNHPDGDIGTKILSLQKKFSFPSSKRAALLFELYSDNTYGINVQKYKKVFSQVIDDENSQLGLLNCIERLCVSEPELLKRTPYIAREFYMEDILSEDVILKWAEKKRKPQIAKEMAPFIKWLQEAEEESEEE